MNTQNNSPVLLGIDIGTTDTKCSFYTPQGEMVASMFSEYSMIHPAQGWVEEEPLDWWNAILQNIKICQEQQGLDLSRVAAVGISCTNAFIPVDRDCNPLHCAIMQIDQRAAAEVEWIEKNIGKDKIYQITGNRIARGTFFMPTILWYLHNRKELVDKAYKFLTPSGYIICKLTGEFTINESRMGFSLLSDIRTGTWSRELVDAIGLDPSKLPRPCRADEIVGVVSAQAAAETGLPQGIPVVGGAMDTVAAAVGAGAISQGDIFMALGTCGRVCHSTSSTDFDARLMNCRNVSVGQYLNVEATNACGVALRWFRDEFGGAVLKDPELSGVPIYQAFNQLAQRSRPGAGGIIFLPYLSGERCPIWDPYARGVLLGMHLDTRYCDIIRAIMEGVAFSLRQGMELMNLPKRVSPGIPLGGGIANSHIWCEIIANVVGQPIIRTDINETETLGDAILAGHSIGLIQDMGAIGKRLIRTGEIIEPTPEIMACYNKYYSVYLDSYVALRDVFLKINKLFAPGELFPGQKIIH